MPLSVAKIDRKDWVTIKDKFVRYKLGKKSFWNPKKKQYSWRGPIHYFCDDWGDSLNFYLFKAEGIKGQKNLVKINKKIKLVYRKNKLNIYYYNQGRVRNVSNKILESCISYIDKKDFFTNMDFY